MTITEAKNKVTTTALGEVGYKETGKNITKYSEFFEGTDFYNGSKGDGKTWGAEWCDIFVDYCFCNVFGMEEGRKMLCQPKKSAGAGCKFSAIYYKQAKRLFTTPEVGDQIFFIVGNDINHTGIVTKVSNGKVYTVEGNSSDEVKTHSYSLTNKKIAGYGRPKYKEAAQTIADTAPVKPNPVGEPVAINPKPITTTPQKPQNTPLKSEEEVAKEVVAGKWGNGKERKQRLTEAGYDYNAIQKIVNQLVMTRPVGVDTFIGTVNTEKYSLNVRAGAGTQFHIVKQLPKGSKVELVSEKVNGWYRLADGSGYVAGNLIKK